MLARLPILAGFGLVALTATAAEKPAPVSVVWSGGQDSPGICVGEEGWFVTIVPENLVPNDENPTVKDGDSEADAEILHFDITRRLCLIQTKTLPGDPTLFTLSPDPVDTPGTVLKSLSTESDCRSTIAGKDWSYRGENLEMPLLRIRVENPEHFCQAGTPLIDESGQVAALLTDRDLAERDEAHAVPAEQIHKLVCDMKRFNRTGPVRIGLLLHELSSTPEILKVRAESPASEAGFAEGDVVLSLNQNEISDLDDLVEAIQNLPAGEKATFGVLRGLSKMKIEVVPEFAEEK